MTQTSDFLPKSKLLRAFIYLPAKLYQLIVSLRVLLYEQNYLKTKDLSKVVISVGNISVGGTGKTPLIEYIARFLSEENLETAILSRGYKRANSVKKHLVISDGKQMLASLAEAGDEAFMLAEKLKGVKVIVGANRFQTGQLAIKDLGCDVILLDDGFQHLKLKRDLDIVVLDATNPFDNGEMLPFGKLREPLYGLKRAQMIVISRADRETNRDLIFQVLSGLELNIPVFYSDHDFVGLRDLASNKPIALRKLINAKVAVLCALGNPDVFISDLESYQAKIVSKHVFIDHHNYQQIDIDKIVMEAKEAKAEFIVTTEKDAVKLQRFSFDLPIYVVEIKVNIEDEPRFKSLILKTIMKKLKS